MEVRQFLISFSAIIVRAAARFSGVCTRKPPGICSVSSSTSPFARQAQRGVRIRPPFTPGQQELANAPRPRHTNGMTATVQLDASNRIVITRDVRRAAGISRRQKLKISAGPGRIVIEAEATTAGRVSRRGRLKVWSGVVPSLPIAEAVEQARHYDR